MTTQKLTKTDHTGLNNLINAAFEGVINGSLSQVSAMNSLAHVVAAIDIGNYDEARKWFHNPSLLDENEKLTNP
ncbi:hypothetical protein JJT54_004462 [Salmonella enterica]|nr:hypothetical protein [Salmonella enterica]